MKHINIIFIILTTLGFQYQALASDYTYTDTSGITSMARIIIFFIVLLVWLVIWYDNSRLRQNTIEQKNKVMMEEINTQGQDAIHEAANPTDPLIATPFQKYTARGLCYCKTSGNSEHSEMVHEIMDEYLQIRTRFNFGKFAEILRDNNVPQEKILEYISKFKINDEVLIASERWENME